MDIFLIKLLMFIGSKPGLIALFIVAYILIRIFLKDNIDKQKSKLNKKIKYLYLMIIIPVYFMFTLLIEPGITNKQILEVSFVFDDDSYNLKRDNDVKILEYIKWDIYKHELFKNLKIGFNKNDNDDLGELEIKVKNAVIVEKNYNLRNIVILIQSIDK